MANITVIGSLAVDIVATMESFPSPGQTVIGQNINYFHGGKGANQAVAAARMGADVEMVGKLGDDAQGDGYRKLLQKEGICTEHVFTSALPTGTAHIFVNSAGENMICTVPSANYDFGFDELKAIEPLLCRTGWAVMQLELRRDVTVELIKLCRKHGVRIVLNPAPACALDADTLSMTYYLTPNETELSKITGMPTGSENELRAAAEYLLSLGVGNVIATLGERGALIANADGSRIIPAFRVTAVDTVAAGDSFNGSLVKFLADGLDIDAAVMYANAAGALAVTVRGAIPSLPTREALDSFLGLQ